jgi:subtilisin family serine protease
MAIIDPGSNPQGRYLGVLDPKLKDEFVRRSNEILANELINSSALDGSGDFLADPRSRCVLFEKLDVVAIDGGLKNGWDRFFTHLEPERTRRAPTPSVGLAMETTKSTVCFRDQDDRTWGLQATATDEPALTDRKIKVGILDSGLDFTHEAFRGRASSFTRRSFVASPVEIDEIGHGTACASVLCGQPNPQTKQRIGVAPEVDLVVAKIFDVQKVSPDVRTLAALDWALAQGCSIISMSIGDQILPSGEFSGVFEAAALAAIRQKVLLVAGAGNNSRRSMSIFEPVDHPANCPSIMAVGALDRCLDVAEFSNRSLMGNGGEINLAAPGRSIRVASAHAVRERYMLKHGTSLAVPFVAGIAALWQQSDAKLTGQSLWNKLVATAKPLRAGISGDDVGKGLVQAP